MPSLLHKLALCFALTLVTASLCSAANPVYGSNTAFVGAGKHVKSAVIGLVIDSRASGAKMVCWDYGVFTNAKIQGQINGVIDKISDNGVERLATIGKTKVEKFDLGQIPAGQDTCNPNQPDNAIDFNIGVAGNCIQIGEPLSAGDIVRWSLKFKKGSKLQGESSLVNVSGSVIPVGSFSSESARALRGLELARELSVQSAFDR